MNAALTRTRVFRAQLALWFTLLCACGGGYGGGGGGGGMGSCGGAYGGSCAPSVSVTNTAGTVSGTVTLAATASAQNGNSVTSVQFRVDGTAVGAADTSSPYSYDWDSRSVADGAHQVTAVVTDSSNQTTTSAAVTLTVNNGSMPVTLEAGQLFPAPATSATASGNFSVDSKSGALGGSITIAGVTPTAVELGDAYAGAQGTAIVTLTKNAGAASHWDVPAATTLSAQQLADVAVGKLYVVVRSAAFPGGELRGQLLPAGIVVKFAALTGGSEVPPVVSAASGQVAVTVNAAALRASAHVNVTGLSATGAEVATGAAGAVGVQLATLVVDASDANHYFNDAITLTSTDATNFTNGLWYGNVFSAANPGGELRGQLAAPAPTLTKVQADIFTPICSVCHTGVGAGLPGVQNLTAGHTYANIVDVTSIEDPSLKRVNPGDPDNSYLVRKIQGSPGIVGVQMPASGPHLTQAQIDEVRAWIAAGALNN